MDTSDTGSYLFKIRQTRDAGQQAETYADFTRGLSISYKPEYRHLAANTELLKELAASTGGTFEPGMDEIFAVTPEEAVRVRRELWPWLLVGALVLFVADVAVRRLDLSGYRVLGRGPRYG